MSLSRYPEYKDSGNPRLGQIPCHWQAMPFKWVIKSNDGGVWGNDPTGDNDAIVLRSTEQTVDGHWCIKDPALRSLTTLERYSSRLKLGDLLVTKSSGSSKHIGKTTLVSSEIAEMQCCFGNFMQRIRTTDSLKPRLAWYFMNNDVARQQLDFLSSSTTGLANLNGTLIGEMLLSVPPKDEQAEICEFLDHETAKIDALIEEQQRLIELLEEKRQAVISHAVSKGLDPDALMKDSGVEWLGDVPAHWRIAPFSYCISIQEGPGILAEDFHDEGVPLVRVSGLEGDWVTLKGSNYLDPDKVAAKWDHFRLKEGDLLISASASMGAVNEVGKEASGAVPYTGLIRLNPVRDVVEKEFVKAFLKSDQFKTQVDLLKAGSTIQHFGPTHLKQMKMALPPVGEQQNISQHIAQLDKQYNRLIREAKEGVELLAERRSALISDAVTGKIDVRNWQSESDAAEPLHVMADREA